MKKTRISRFVIKDLYHYQNVDIQFEDRYKILIGENGVGKTTVLNCLYYLLNKKFEKLSRIDFLSMELHFSNKTKISFSKSDLNYFIERPKKYKRSHFYDVLTNSITSDQIGVLKDIVEGKMSDQVKRIKTVEFLNNIGVKISAPSSFIYDNITKFIVESEALDFTRVIDRIEKEISSKILYFPTYRRIEEELKNIGKFPKAEVLERYSDYLDEDELNSLEREITSDEDDIIQFGMADVEERIDNITQLITKSSMIGFSQITGELLSQLLKGFPNKISRSSLKDLA